VDRTPESPEHRRTEDLRAVQAAVTTVGRVQHSHRARRQIEDRSGVPLGPTTIATLAAIHTLGPVRHRAVARRAGLQPSRVSKEVRVLVDAGMVTEHADPADRRAVLLEATEKGADAHARYVSAAEETLAEVLAGWTDRDLHRLADLTTRLAACFARGVAPSTTD
jgi:DNA-binding MarR family transcriptional regulator